MLSEKIMTSFHNLTNTFLRVVLIFSDYLLQYLLCIKYDNQNNTLLKIISNESVLLVTSSVFYNHIGYISSS